MNNNTLVLIDTSDALQAQNFTPDTTRPHLVQYNLDMDYGTGRLWLTFSETMLISSFNVTEITLDGSPYANESEYTLHSDSTPVEGSFDDTVVAIVISLYDSNEIKKLTTLATSREDTYLSLTNQTITDMNDNELIETASPEQVRNYTEDTTSPTLDSFTIDLDSNILTLFFSETVNVDTLNVEEITLQDSQDTLDDTVWLSQLSSSDSYNDAVIEIDISSYDRNILTAMTNLYNEKNDSYITLTNYAINDMANNSLIPINSSMALITSDYTLDITNPSLLNFTVDLDKGAIYLLFNETVSLETIDYTRFHLHSDEYGSISVNLTNGSFNEYFTHEVVVYMVRSDIDRTKVTEYLWTNVSNTWLFIEDGAIFDWTMMNPVESGVLQTDEKPMEIEGPVLQSYAVNMTSGVIILNFNEPVRPRTLVYQRILFQNAANNYTMDYRLSGGSSPSGNGRMVKIQLTSYDLNFVKSLTNLYTNENTTYLTLSSGTIRDMVMNPSIPIYGKQVDIYMDDTNRPYLVSYELDMNEGIMMLNFSETVDVSTFNLPSFVLQVDSNVSYDQAMDFHYFSYQTTAMSSDYLEMLDNKTVVIDIHLDDLNEIKRKMIATSINTTWLVIEDEALFDNNEQPVIPLVNGITAKQPVIYINDETNPVLLRFDLSMDAGTLVLSFSETVDATTLDVTQITIQDYFFVVEEAYALTNSSSLYQRPEIGYTSCADLSSGSGSPSGSGSGIFSGFSVMVEFGDVVNSTNDNSSDRNSSMTPPISFNNHTLIVYLSHEDLNNIKALTFLATSRYRTYISLSERAVYDMVGNKIQEISENNATRVTEYEYDDTRPEVVSFDLDIDSGNLTITFTETINVSSLDVTQLTLQSENDHFGSVLSTYTLKSSPPYPNTSQSFSEDGPVIVIQIGHEDLNAIKKIRTLANHESNTYLSWTSTAISDNDDNPIIACLSLFAQEVNLFTEDMTRPELTSFDLDMNDGRLILTFSETVKVIDSLDVTQITLQADSELSEAAGVVYTLTDIEPFESSSIDEDGPVVTLMIGFTDLNAIKYLTELATSRNDTFISITNTTIVDMEDLQVVDIPQYNAQKVRIHTADTTSPVLLRFTLDMDSTTLVLTFNETVDTDTLNVSHIVFQHDNMSSIDYHSSPYALTPGPNETYTSSDNGHIVVIHLGPADRNELKRRQNLTVSINSTWLIVYPDAINDMNGNDLVEIRDGNALQAEGFVSDETPPVLVDFSIDMDASQFVLTFDETVRAKTLVIDAITLQDNASYINSTYTLTDGSSSQSDSTMLTVNISEFDLNQLKKLSICRQVSDCYILHEFATVFDMNNNPIDNRDNGQGLESFRHIPDITNPVLLFFDTNLTSETMTLTFTETVNASSINFTAFTLQDFFEASYSYTLTDGKVQEEDSTIITFNFSWYDLNEIKRNTDIYTDRTNSWLTITQYAIHDMALDPNYVIPVLNTEIVAEGLVTEEFYPDVTPPELWDFDLNLTSHELILYFSETMLARTLDINEITIQNRQKAATEIVKLTMGELPWYSQSFSEDNHIIVIKLGQIDTDRIKAFTDLATENTNTFISHTVDTIEDMARNKVVEISPSYAHIVQVLYEDTIRPTLLAFELDLNTAQLSFTFSEAVNASSMEVNEITIHSVEDGTNVSWTLTNLTEANMYLGTEEDDFGSSSTSAFGELFDIEYEDMSGSTEDIPPYSGNCTEDKSAFSPYHSYTNSKDLPIIILELGFLDINELNTWTNLATFINNTYISMTKYAINDMNKNRLVEVPWYNSTEASEVIPDSTPPNIVFFDLNMTSEILSLTFDEVVRADSLNVQFVVLQDMSYVHLVSNDSVLRIYQLKQGIGSVIDDYIIYIELDTDDLNNIKRLRRIATAPENTYLTFGTDLITDMHGNKVTEVDNGEGVRVSCFTEDIIKPELKYFHLDMNEGQLFLTFSETVDAQSFDVTQIRLQDAQSNQMGRARKLSSESYDIYKMDHTVISIQLGFSDLNRIKATEMFGLGIVDTWITIRDELIDDMNYNPVVEIPDGQAQQASNFTLDTTSPYLLEYHLDFVSETMTLHFNEPINISSIDYTEISFQDGFSSDHNYSLTDGEANSYNDALTIVITFNKKDIDYLKMHPSLLTSANDSYITFTSVAFYDTATNPNPVLPLIDGVNATGVSTFTYYPPPEFVSVRPTAGRASGGTIITIAGNNFGPPKGEKGERQVDVLLDFIPSLNTTVIEANVTLQAVTPEADSVGIPVTLTITVDNSALMINISEAFTYLASPVINRIYPTAGTFNGGTLLTIYGENFGPSTLSEEGPEVSVTIEGDNCTNPTVLSNYTLTCITPHLEPGSHDVTVTVDEVSTIFEDAFTSLYPPTVTAISPNSTYKDTPILVTITGNAFGPTTSSNDGKPVIVILTSALHESECTDVNITVRDIELTCIAQANLGPSNITIIVDGIESDYSNITFFYYDDAGNFSFEVKEFYVSEGELYGNVTVSRRAFPKFASPANITIQALDGTAISPFYYIETRITKWLPYPENSVTFQILITAMTYEPERIRKGEDDDRYLNVRITSVIPLHGEANITDPTATLTIKALCNAVTHLCIADWDVNTNSIVYYRLDELP